MKLGRIILFFGVFGGLGAIAFLTFKPKEIPNMTISIPQAQAAAVSSPTAPIDEGRGETPTAQKSRVAVARDAYLGQAIDALDSQLTNMVCSRKNEYVSKANEWAQQTGGSIERWLLDRLEALKSDSAKNSNAFTGLNGTADQFTYSKDFGLDTLALLSALQDTYNGNPDRGCLTNFAESFQKIDKFGIEANTYRALLNQQQQKLLEGGQAANVKP